MWVNGFQINGGSKQQEEGEEEETPEPLRNFTLKQLRHFDGKIDEKSEEPRPVYLSLGGTVFDVSKGRDFYGPGGPYESFAGRECGAALAKMSFEESLLDDMTACECLGVGEKRELENWLEKFEHYRCYPIIGRVVPDSKLPCQDRIITAEELAKFDGKLEGVPDGEFEGYATHPIYVAAFDKDASRALALMSFDPKDVENTYIGDLEEKQVKVLMDWVKTFEEKKGYPVVGKLDKKI
ncbi:hypothetical protein ACHAXS_008777 [Conticribra weissflogii]